MRNSCAVSIKLFVRSMRYIVPYAAVLCISSVVMLLLHQSELTAVDFLTSSLMLGIVGFLYFSFTGYELTSTLSRVGGEECVSALPAAKRSLVFAQILTMMLPLLLWSALLFGGQVLDYTQRGLTYTPYLLHALLAVLLYGFAPGCLGLLLGACLAKTDRPTAYALMIFATLLCSSIGLTLFGGGTIGGISLASVFDWFSITVPNSTWLADTVYGVAMEKCRWILAAFWTLLLTGILLWSYRAQGNRAASVITCLCLIAAALCGVRFALRGGDSILIKDQRSDGILQGEYTYRLAHESEETAEADFTVKRYELSFSIDDSLDAVATVQVSPTNLEEYRFTLYHGYTVSSVVDDSGEALSFVQDGDYLTIASVGPVESLTITYSGNGNKYYANSQGISLPGYFAYYPMAGYLTVWDDSSNSFSVNTDFDETEFYVQVSSSQRVFSNLPQTSENTFEGVTDTVSLYAGLMEQTEIDGVTYIYSPVSDQTIEIDKTSVAELWENLCALTGETRSLSLDGKVIIFQPLTIVSAAGQNEGAVILADQLLLCDFQPSAESICRSYFESGIPVSTETSLLRQVFLDALFSESDADTNEKPAYSDLQMLLKYNSADEIIDTEEWEAYLYESEVLFYELMDYQVTQLGKDVVMREVYQYLTETEHSVNQVDFLYSLGGEE